MIVMTNMNREYQVGGFYHVYNRGNHRQPVFIDDFDYEYFLRQIDMLSKEYEVIIAAYCLMKNHYHFLLQLGNRIEGIERVMSRAVMRYVYYFNRKYLQVGRLFQSPYNAKPVLTDAYLLHLSRYIHLNPAEFADPWTYRWSSISAYRYRKSHIAEPSYILKMLDGHMYDLGELSHDQKSLASPT
jgi:putative transposase